MTRRPWFWVAFAGLGVAGVVAAVRLFSVALPNIALEIDMDRDAAIAAAADFAGGQDMGPADARSAASFGQVDPEVQTYVELEGGGRDAFQALTSAGAYQPYQWRVRRFAEAAVEELEVRFTPAGDRYGFRLRLPEDDPGGGNLDEAAAGAAAERGARDQAVDLSLYERIEASQQVRPSGRVDHTFVYERGDVTLGEARFRLRLVVSGDRLTELTHYVFVPEAFSRRYAEMRSTNDAIALVAQAVFFLGYLLLGAGVGTALLLRDGWIVWRRPLAWGFLTAFLFAANSLNALPLAWMGYDTAVSAEIFVLQNLALAGAILLLGSPLLAFCFMAGESLGRRAFPEHLQQWRFWSPEVAASTPALGLTVAAYLLVGAQIGYVVLFYLGTSRLQGWWSPADALVQPDLLATYLPWLQAVSISLFASLWEESVFRAVPIACAALIGARLGRRSAWVWTAVALQALVFAAGHANYPQQPPYARVVELWLPAFVWGVVYVRHGLVTTIIAHFLYDLTLFSSVLFASDALLDQAVIVVFGAVPLAIVLWARRRGRRTSHAPEWAFNRSWMPEARGTGADDGGPAPERPSLTAPDSPRLAPWVAPACATAGAALWLATFVGEPTQPRLEPTRSEAIALARGELDRQGHDLSGWAAAATTGDGRGSAHAYVFEEAGAEVYDALVGSFLAPPQWIVRFVDWEAEPEERVEQHLVNVGAGGEIRRTAHTVPESRPGASLRPDSARALARSALPPGDWEEVGAEETTHAGRTDWELTYRSRTVLASIRGEARAVVSVLGDEVTDVRRLVDVPEEWEREQREVESRRLIGTVGVVFGLVLLYGAAAITAIVVWSRGGLDTRPVAVAAAVTAVALAASALNGWPSTTALFSTAQPFGFQAGGAAIGIALFVIVGGAAIGLVTGLAHAWAEAPRGAGVSPLLGVGLGLLVAGLSGAASAVVGGLPAMPDYSGAASAVPVLAFPLGAIAPYLLATSAFAALAAAHRRFVDRPALRTVTFFAVLSLGLAAVPEAIESSIPVWLLASGLAVGVIFGLVRVLGRWPALTPIVFGTVTVVGMVDAVRDRAYSGSPIGAALAIVVVAGLARLWARALARPPGAETG